MNRWMDGIKAWTRSAPMVGRPGLDQREDQPSPISFRFTENISAPWKFTQTTYLHEIRIHQNGGAPPNSSWWSWKKLPTAITGYTKITIRFILSSLELCPSLLLASTVRSASTAPTVAVLAPCPHWWAASATARLPSEAARDRDGGGAAPNTFFTHRWISDPIVELFMMNPKSRFI
jgi:hypothetical protein